MFNNVKGVRSAALIRRLYGLLVSSRQSNSGEPRKPSTFSNAESATLVPENTLELHRGFQQPLHSFLQRLSMSTGPKTQAAFIQGNQSKVEHDGSHSALFYLFQEVSKLASPIHHSFLDTNPPTKRRNETSWKDPLVVKREEENTHSFQTSKSFCQHNLSHTLPYNQVKIVKEESNSSKVTALVQPHYESNSTWKVLSLINMHCEQLLHQRDVEELDPSSVSSATTLGHSTVISSTAALDLTEGEVRSDSVEQTLRPSLHCYDRQEITAAASPVEDVSGDCTGDGYKLQRCVKDCEVDCSVQLQTAEKTDTAGAEFLEDNAEASLQSQHIFKRKVKFSVNRQLEWSPECKKDCSATEQDIVDVHCSQNALPQTYMPNACLNTQLTFNSNGEAFGAQSKPAPALDHNANITLSTESPCDTQLPPSSSVLPSSRSASLTFSTPETCNSLSEQDDECTRAPVEEKSPPVAQLKLSSHIASKSEPELWAMQNEETGLPSVGQWRTKTPRKQPHPCRSADIQDPDFQGVTFRMDTELDDSREQCRLLITSKYSKELGKSVRKPKLRTRTSQKSLKTSSSDEENNVTTNVLKDKVCASCCTRKTPMWRDAEDGTPLCNACGIRYKKYRVRCVNCWHIPRKEGNSNSLCPKCGNFVRLTSAQRKHTT